MARLICASSSPIDDGMQSSIEGPFGPISAKSIDDNELEIMQKMVLVLHTRDSDFLLKSSQQSQSRIQALTLSLLTVQLILTLWQVQLVWPGCGLQNGTEIPQKGLSSIADHAFQPTSSCRVVRILQCSDFLLCTNICFQFAL